MRLSQRFMAGMTVLIGANLLFAAGCATQSPAVGTWKGKPSASGMLGQMLAQTSGEAIITLKADGSGFAKLPPLPEQPVTWSEKERKVTLTLSNANPANSGNKSAPAPSSNSVVGTVAEDGRTMRVDLGVVALDLQKQEGAP